MSAGLLRAMFFCLATGAAMGCLFLLFKGIGILLRAGKLLTAALDLLYCCLCGAAVFLCALAVDRGRFRLFQAGFQLLGGWAAAAALGPFTDHGAEALRKIFCKVSALFRRAGGFVGAHFRPRRRKPGKRPEKNRKKLKKAQKKT